METDKDREDCLEEKNMEKKYKVLIADSYPEESKQLREELQKQYDVIAITEDGEEALLAIKKLKPDLVIIDLMLPGIDGLGVIEKCREVMSPEEIPAFIALTMIENQDLMEYVRYLKVDYCMMKPFQAKILVERITQMIRIRTVNTKIQKDCVNMHKDRKVHSICDSNDIRREISRLIRNLGVPAHIKGCRYIKFGILMAMEDANSVNYITKSLYPDIAKKCNTTTSSVERAIRHAIDIIWIRGNKKMLGEIFGTFAIEEQERPTNSEFIAAVADWMRLEYQIRVS